MSVFTHGKTKSGQYCCRILTLDAELQFTVEGKVKGQTIFSLICQTLGLREHWYFGLKYLNRISQEWTWLQMNRTIFSHPIQISANSLGSNSAEVSSQSSHFLLRSSPTTSTLNLTTSSNTNGHHALKGTIELYFLVKFYPEEINHELIQDITRHLFYLQVKQDVLNMNIYCPPDTAAHLASLSLQIKFGDYDQAMSSSTPMDLDNESLLPLSCFQKIELSRSDWLERIRALWRTHLSLTREDARTSYLKHAQDLDMFGLTFFEISKIHGANRAITSSLSQPDKLYRPTPTAESPATVPDLWLGIDSLGIRFYKKNKLQPEVFFTWSDVRSVVAREKKMILNLIGDKHPTFAFYAAQASISREILDLATGNHQLSIRRRREEPMEIQQMRYFEERQQKEKARLLARERQLRIQAEQRRDQIEHQCLQHQEAMGQIQKALLRYQETTELLAYKARTSSEEARLQSEKALEVQSQLEQCRDELNRNQEEKQLHARQISQCEQVISILVNSSVKHRKEAEELKLEVARWRLAEAATRDKLLTMAQLTQSLVVCSDQTKSSLEPVADDRNHSMDKQSQQRQLAQQLQDLKNVIQSKTIEERQTVLDKAHQENLAGGENKYSTIQKARSGTASKRMAMLQDL